MQLYDLRISYMAKKNPHRGEILQNVVEASGLSVSLIAKRAGYKSTTSYYDHITKRDLSLEIISRYGKALNYDFSLQIPEIKSVQSFIENENPQTIKQALKERDHWRDKYYELLEKHHDALKMLASLNSKATKK